MDKLSCHLSREKPGGTIFFKDRLTSASLLGLRLFYPLTPVASASSTSSLVSCPFCSHRLTTLSPTTGRNPPDLFYDRRRENSQILIRLPPPPPAHPLALPTPPSFSPAPSPPNQNLQQGGNLRVGGGGSGNRLLA
jgi:hypothetical protein